MRKSSRKSDKVLVFKPMLKDKIVFGGPLVVESWTPKDGWKRIVHQPPKTKRA